MTPTPTTPAAAASGACSALVVVAGLMLVAAACGDDDDAADTTVPATTEPAPETTEPADDDGARGRPLTATTTTAADDHHRGADHDARTGRSRGCRSPAGARGRGEAVPDRPALVVKIDNVERAPRPQQRPQRGRHRVRGDRRGAADPLRRRLPLRRLEPGRARSAAGAPRTSTCSAGSSARCWCGAAATPASCRASASPTSSTSRPRSARPGLLPAPAQQPTPHNLCEQHRRRSGRPRPPEAGRPTQIFSYVDPGVARAGRARRRSAASRSDVRHRRSGTGTRPAGPTCASENGRPHNLADGQQVIGEQRRHPRPRVPAEHRRTPGARRPCHDRRRPGVRVLQRHGADRGHVEPRQPHRSATRCTTPTTARRSCCSPGARASSSSDRSTHHGTAVELTAGSRRRRDNTCGPAATGLYPRTP